MSRKLTEIQENEIINSLTTLKQKDAAIKHNISVCTISNILKRRNVKSLSKGRFIKDNALPLNVKYFENIDTKEKAYWLGYLAADGSVKKGKVTLVSKDLEIIQRFKNAIESGHKISERKLFDKRTNKIYDTNFIQICSEQFSTHLSNAGVTKDKSLNYTFPNLNEKLQSYFIAGLFDGDGSIYSTHDKLGINLISTKEVLLTIQSILYKKISCNLLTLNKIETTKTISNLWKMFLYKDSKIFLDYIYGDKSFKYLTRKYDLYKKIDIKYSVGTRKKYVILK